MAKKPPGHKRQKVVHEAPTSEEIHTSRQLKQLLAFDQDLQKARHGLQSFKVFLDGLLSSENGADDEKVQILRDYLESARRQDGESEATCLPDIMETWSSAVQATNDNVMSTVAVALALLIKFISSRLDLTAFGLSIGRTLLQPRQQELIARNLSADKDKAFILSPTLRLLRELICLDGGALAKRMFRGQSLTFKNLARNMGIKHLGTGLEDVKRPSPRTNAIRFFLSAIKFLPTEGKRELLSQRELPSALTKSLLDDPPYLIFEILETLQNHIIKDSNLANYSKCNLLNAETLGRLSSLYKHKQHSAPAEGSSSTVEDAVHEFLIVACTWPSAGVLRPQSGFYPPKIDQDALRLPSVEDEFEPGLESITWVDKFKDDVPVHNKILAKFIQSKSLRPWSSQKHIELLVAVFTAAPELVAHYFINKQPYTIDIKSPTTWRMYSIFLIKTIQSRLPKFFGHKNRYALLPPPTSIILDNIIPRPLDQKVLVKCLMQKDDMVSFPVVKLLEAVMRKLQVALAMHADAEKDTSSVLWKESAKKLTDFICDRIPAIKEIISFYREVGDSDLEQREAASNLLRLYYEVLPKLAFKANFNVSSLLVTSIQRFEGAEGSIPDEAPRRAELENLLIIAAYSPGIKWFSKAQGLSASPFVTLLRVSVAAPTAASLEGLKTALETVAEHHYLIPDGRGHSLPLLTALHSMKGSHDPASWGVLWTLLDNSLSRCGTNSVKYLEIFEDFVAAEKIDDSASFGPMRPFTFALLEQLPFALSSAGEDEISALANLVATYMSCTRSLSDSDSAFDALREKFKSAFSKKLGGKRLFKKYMTHANAARGSESSNADISMGENHQHKPKTEDSKKGERLLSEDALAEILSTPLSLPQDNSALSKWATKEADELVEEGHAASVATLLTSEHTSIRKEARVSIAKMAAKIHASSYEEKDQVHLLLMELVESCKDHVDAGPIPNYIVAFARNALDVLQNPLHCIYPKVNQFLLKGPTWQLDKMPLVFDILDLGPSDNDAYYNELSWLFSYLLDGLQGRPDMNLYHNKRFFERVLSLGNNPYMRANLITQILKIIYRATCIESGSTTLITRFGIVPWLEMRSAVSETDREVCKALLRRTWETSDKARVSEWSNGGIEDAVRRTFL